MEDRLSIDMSRNSAIVLFDLLNRFCADLTLVTADYVEEKVLWDLLANLERVLTEPFSPDYGELLAKARESLVEPHPAGDQPT